MELPITIIAGFVILILIDFKSNKRLKNKLKIKMEKLEVSTEKLRTEYEAGDAKKKSALVKLFGKETFTPKITDQVLSWEDVCKIKKLDPVKSLPFPKAADDQEKAINAYFKLRAIVSVLVGDWKPNWDNGNEYKYYPYFNMASGFGFSYGVWSYSFSVTAAGSRLCFPNKELAIFAGKTFTSIYKDFYTL